MLLTGVWENWQFFLWYLGPWRYHTAHGSLSLFEMRGMPMRSSFGLEQLTLSFKVVNARMADAAT